MAAILNPLTPLGLSLLKGIPLVNTVAITMCHYDQYLIFSSFLSGTAVAPETRRSLLAHTMERYVAGALPLIIALEFSLYGALAANVYFRLPEWKWCAVGLACALSHLVNAPYSWKLLTALRRGIEEGDNGKKEVLNTLKRFVCMEKVRFVLTELPLLCIVIRGALQ